MRITRLVLALTTACIGLAVAAIGVGAGAAADTGANSIMLKPQGPALDDIHHPQGFWPMLGFGFGVMDHNEVSRTGGIPGQVKALGSYYFQDIPLVADVGVGLQNEFLTQTGGGENTIQSAYSEFASRYVLTNGWQLGAIWNTLIDNSHRFQSNNDNLASFVGAQVLKEITWSDEYLVRFGGRAVTSLGLNGGSVNMVMAELEFSFGQSGPKSSQDAALAPSPVSVPKLADPPTAALEKPRP